MTSYLVWGVGAASSPLLREARAVQGDWPARAIADVTNRAGGDYTDAWCVVVTARPDEVDVATRFDAAVVGYMPVSSDD